MRFGKPLQVPAKKPENYELIKPLVAYLHLNDREIEMLLSLPRSTLETFVTKLHKHKAMPQDEEMKTKNLLWCIWKCAADEYPKIVAGRRYPVLLEGSVILGCMSRARVLYELDAAEKPKPVRVVT